MILLILLLIFASISVIAYQLIPVILQRYHGLQTKRMERVSKELHQMLIFTEEKKLTAAFTIVPLTLGIIGFLLFRNPVAGFIGLGIGFILPKLYVAQIGRKRIRVFSSQLVDALLLINSSLKAGMSLTQAFTVLVEEMPAPISDEFAKVIRENQMGLTVEDCLVHLKQRIPLVDLELLTIAVSIARETGGDLTEIFDNLVTTIREKKKLENRVKTLTVQGRLQGAIMGILPIGFGIFVYFTNPNTFDVMLKDKVGQMLLIWAFVSEIIGIFLIKKLSRVEV